MRDIIRFALRSPLPSILVCLSGVAGSVFSQGAYPANPEQWLARHNSSEFTGKVWVRFRVDGPPSTKYAAIVDCETDPFKPARRAVGTVTASGLKTLPWQAELDNHWPKSLPWVEPGSPGDWISAGETTEWIELPVSTKRQWHCAVILRMPGRRQFVGSATELTFASAPNDSAVFRTVIETPDESGAIPFLMPTRGGSEGLRMLKTFSQWSEDRRKLVASVVPVPSSQPGRLKIRTWVNFKNYRKGGGSPGREIAENDFWNLRQLGINGIGAISLGDELLGELSDAYGMRGTMLKAWATGLSGFIRRGKGKYDFRPGESPEARFDRIFNDYYSKFVADLRKDAPNRYRLSDHVILGDEITGVVRSDRIESNPGVLHYFREWLKAQGLRPGELGARSWEDLVPAHDRSRLTNGSLEYAKNFYFTRRFVDHYTQMYYRSATRAVESRFPQADLIAVNYQAGPMQFGFIGSDNNLDRGQLDIFELGRTRSFKGAMTEDWVKGWDLGIGREMFGAAVIRASARKHDLPLAAYLVGGEAVRAEMIGYVSQGIREINMYIYGPISNKGPAWADRRESLKQTAETIGMLARMDSAIVSSKLKPARAAMLVSTAYDIMQAGGRSLIPERQDLFVALAHSNIPVDLISEQDILEDGLLGSYSILYVSDPQVPGAVQMKIADWVKGGGRLWASAGALRFDEFNRPSDTMDRVFGVRSRRTIEQEGGIQTAAPPWTDKVNRFELKPLGTLTLNGGLFRSAVDVPVRGLGLKAEPDTATVIGTYSDRSPGAFENKYGAGRAYLIGALVGNAYVNAHYPGDPGGNDELSEDWNFSLGSDLAAAAALPATDAGARLLELSVPGVYASVMESGGSYLIFLNNASGRPIREITVKTRFPIALKGAVSAKGSALRSGTANSFSLSLENADIILVSRP